jgi:hypothetical protein
MQTVDPWEMTRSLNCGKKVNIFCSFLFLGVFGAPGEVETIGGRAGRGTTESSRVFFWRGECLMHEPHCKPEKPACKRSRISLILKPRGEIRD